MAVSVPVELDRLFGQPSWLDRIAEPVQNVVRGAFASQGPAGLRIRNLLNGVWLGHPLHAALTDLPIGAFTAGVSFDYLGAATGRRWPSQIADVATVIGVGSALAAAIAGLADFSEIEDEQRRVGMAHALLNVLGVSTYAASVWRRRQADRRGALALATLGYALIVASADLGGQMVYHLGTLVNRQAWTRGPARFTPVLPASDLREGEPRRVEAEGTAILLARVNGHVYALGDTCTHWGCSLAEGHLEDRSVVCHCHGSRFDLRDGAVRNGPATSPEISFEVRERGGQIEIRQRPY